MFRAGEGIQFSLVIPIFNEEAVLPLLFDRLDDLLAKLEGLAEVILVDDGSRDASGLIAVERARRDKRYHYLALSRNFGHQVAISAGMKAAAGNAVIILDADLQDPPEVVLALVEKWREGFDVVYAERVSRDGETRLKLWTAEIFYRVLRYLTAVDIPRNVGDFRLVDRKAVDAFNAMPERDRFVRGMFGWMGFRQAAVQFHRMPRVQGTTKYTWRKMVRLAVDAVIGFSDVPLRLALWCGSTVSIAALLYGFYVTWLAFHDPNLVPGWASTVVILSFLSGMNLIMLGVVGLYVGRIHAEVKDRPLYLIARAVGAKWEQKCPADPNAGSDPIVRLAELRRAHNE